MAAHSATDSLPTSISSLPTTRDFVTSLINTLAQTRQHQDDTSPIPILNLDSNTNTKHTLLTLHALFPHELLPALDLLDRRLITRPRLAPHSPVNKTLNLQPHHEAQSEPDHRPEPPRLGRRDPPRLSRRDPAQDQSPARAAPPAPSRLQAAPPLDLQDLVAAPHPPPPLPPSPGAQHPDPFAPPAHPELTSHRHHPQRALSPAARPAHQSDPGPGLAHPSLASHSLPGPLTGLYYVRSAQRQAGSRSKWRDRGDEPARQQYEVRLLPWSCSCPAFAFSAFPAARSDAGVSSDERPCVEWDLTSPWDGESWAFGGLSEGDDLPVCKHLLACVLIHYCPVFAHLAEEREVGVDEVAAWAAGWGD